MWDFQALAYLAYANITTLMLASLISSTKSKYATIASARVVILSAFMEVMFTITLLLTYFKVGSSSLDGIGYQETALFFSAPLLALILCVYAIFEAKRAPFDHTEAESELVAGHLIEFGGRTLLLFFICEYAHVYFCIFTLLVFCFGGLGCTNTQNLILNMIGVV
jgi:NADH-quinone oxidoreductase subunit H